MSPNPLETAGLVTFTEENLNGKLHFLYGESFDNKNEKKSRNCNQPLLLD